MTPRAERRGQPIVALGSILGLWILARIVVWTWGAEPNSASASRQGMPGMAFDPPVAARRLAVPFAVSRPAVPKAPALAQALSAPPALPIAAFSSAPGAVEPVLAQPDPPPSSLPPVSSPRSPSRWSGDTWLLLRRDGGPASLAASGGSYGASQAGAVLRYRLDQGSGHRPALYLRGSAALGRWRDQEAALGLSARPLPQIGLAMMGELRANRGPAGIHLRPAVLVVSELPEQNLPWHLNVEAYVQAGYVGGRAASAFADGQARVERQFAGTATADLRLGAGLWGGAQQGAARLDLGPTVSLALPMGGSGTARLRADWRFRVAGRAAPGSGPALTLSAGF